MSELEIKMQAISLANSTNEYRIIEWLQGWIDMQPEHSQYQMRDDQIKIGKLAIRGEQ